MIREVLQSGARDDPVGATWDGGAQCIATNSLLEDLSRKSVPGTELVLPLTSAVSLSCGARERGRPDRPAQGRKCIRL